MQDIIENIIYTELSSIQVRDKNKKNIFREQNQKNALSIWKQDYEQNQKDALSIWRQDYDYYYDYFRFYKGPFVFPLYVHLLPSKKLLKVDQSST